MKKTLLTGSWTMALLLCAAPAVAQAADECDQLVYGPAGAPKTATPAPAPATAPKPATPATPTAPTTPPKPNTTVPVRGSNGTVGGQPVRVKDGSVNTGGLTANMRNAVDDVYRIAADLGMRTPVITSAKDGTHKTGSRHYSGNAIDVRCNTTYASSGSCKMFAAELRRSLGPAYDVIFEDFGPGNPNNHIHIEYDPKG